MPRFNSAVNYGFGKKMSYAAFNALRYYFGGGRFSTVHSHAARWGLFCRFLILRGIDDVCQVGVGHVLAFGGCLADMVFADEMAVSYAQNILSSINIVLEAMRRDRRIWVSPAEVVGKKSEVRTVAPTGMDLDSLDVAVAELFERGHGREAILVLFARCFGMRLREAALGIPSEFLEDAEKRGEINILRGTKGGRGRHCDRWLPVTDKDIGFLEKAYDMVGPAECLIPNEKSWIEFQYHARSVAFPILKDNSIKDFRDLRAAYACQIYHQMTG